MSVDTRPDLATGPATSCTKDTTDDMAKAAKTKAAKIRPGRRSLFRGKVREHPVTITFTALHLRKLRQAESRLGVTRADVLGLLVDKHADNVQLPDGATVAKAS